jgi:hypothetical protein
MLYEVQLFRTKHVFEVLIMKKVMIDFISDAIWQNLFHSLESLQA